MSGLLYCGGLAEFGYDALAALGVVVRLEVAATVLSLEGAEQDEAFAGAVFVGDAADDRVVDKGLVGLGLFNHEVDHDLAAASVLARVEKSVLARAFGDYVICFHNGNLLCKVLLNASAKSKDVLTSL